MATQLQIRRGTSTQVAAFTGAEGEIVVNTTNDSVHVNDGSTAGGFELARADLNNVSDTSLNAALTGNTVSALTVTSLTSSGINVTGTVTADGLTVDGDAQFNTGAGGIAEFFHSSGYGGIKATGAATGSGATVYLSNDKSGTPFDIYTIFADGSNDSLQFWSGGNPASGTKRFNAASNGDISFYEDTGTTPKFFWDASAEKLELSNLKLYSDNVRNEGGILYIGTSGNNATQFYNNDANTLHISGAGNVGIGTSSPNAAADLHVADTSDTRIWIEATSGDTMELYAGTDVSVFNRSNNALKFGTNNAERMRIDSSGDLLWHQTPSSSASGIAFTNTTHPSIVVSGGADTAFRHRVVFVNGNGTVGIISTNGSATTYATSSDYRLKENVVPLTGATERLKQLNPSRFNFIADADVTVDGFLAHEVQDIVPEAITGTKDAVDDDGNAVYQGIDQSKLVPLLVATIQELEARITQLENN